MIAAVALAAALAQTPVDDEIVALRAAGLPAPAVAFVERRMGCNHWAGEEPYDPERGREIERALRAGRCDRIERDERALMRRYRHQPKVLDAITRTRDWN